MRVIHASPDAPAVDVYLDGNKVGELEGAIGVIPEEIATPATLLWEHAPPGHSYRDGSTWTRRHAPE